MAIKISIVSAFAVAVWAFCGAIMGIGPQIISMEATLIIHAIGGPLGAAIAAVIYFHFFGDISPLALATAFVGVAMTLDFFVVSPLFVGNYGMFASLLGLWIPMALIFAATWFAGSFADRRLHP